jgi:hypothetical protein
MANHYESLLSVLLCCLPFLALLLFKQQLQLGVIRVMGNHYNLNRSTLTTTPLHQCQTSKTAIAQQAEFLPPGRALAVLREGSGMDYISHALCG